MVVGRFVEPIFYRPYSAKYVRKMCLKLIKLSISKRFPQVSIQASLVVTSKTFLMLMGMGRVWNLPILYFGSLGRLG